MSIYIGLDHIIAPRSYFPYVYAGIGGTEEGILSDRGMKQSAVQLVDHSPVRYDGDDGFPVIPVILGKNSV